MKFAWFPIKAWYRHNYQWVWWKWYKPNAQWWPYLGRVHVVADFEQ